MFGYQIMQSPTFTTDSVIIDNIIKTIQKEIPIPQQGSINLVFVSPEKIKNLNNSHRKKDTATDVLSFHYHEDYTHLQSEDIA